MRRSVHVSAFIFLARTLCSLRHATALSTPYGSTSKNVATQVLQGAGPALGDLNKYNLDSLEEIEQEWTANLVQKAAEQVIQAKLGVKTDTQLFVDTVLLLVPRKGSLGVELVEIAGGREDGLGITLVSGVVSGGSADGSDVLPGDAIAEVAVVRQRQQPSSTEESAAILSDMEEMFVAKTECLSYDATVEELSKLPPPSGNSNEFYSVKLKRIRRKPKVQVKLQYPPSQNEPDTILELFAGENLRYGMLVRGVKLNDPLAKRFDTKNGGNCGAGGLCRTCSVAVVNGGELLNPQRPAEEQMLADNPRWRLACKAIVGHGMKEGTMTIRVAPQQW